MLNKKRILWAAALVFVSTGCDAAQDVSVGIFRAKKPSHVSICSRAGVAVVTDNGSFNVSTGATVRASGSRVGFAQTGSRTRTFRLLECHGNAGNPLDVMSGSATVALRGKVTFRAEGDELVIVNKVRLEDYVRGVVASEMDSTWPSAALKAQAVVARTLALARSGHHADEGFDLCDTTHCQVYRGCTSETQSTDAAVDATRGQIVTFKGLPIEALYCSTCGGGTSCTFGSKPLTDAPYLRAQKDILNGASACKSSPHYQWRRTIGTQDLKNALASDSRTDPGSRLSDIRVVARNSSGRASAVEIAGQRTVEVDGYVFWNVLCRAIGWGKIKSAQFTIKQADGKFEFCGYGLGHGIGMCQWGAKARAKSGWDWSMILDFYYPGCRVRSVERI